MAIGSDREEGVALGEGAPQRAALTGRAPPGLIHVQRLRVSHPREQVLMGLGQCL
jgi:hypothetical protein